MNKNDVLDELFSCYLVAEYASLRTTLDNDLVKQETYKQANFIKAFISKANERLKEVEELKHEQLVGLTRNDIEGRTE